MCLCGCVFVFVFVRIPPKRACFIDFHSHVPRCWSAATTHSPFLLPAPQLAPMGVPGELFVGGEKLALGYLNRDDLSAAKFVPDPFRPGGTYALPVITGQMCRACMWRNFGIVTAVSGCVLRPHRECTGLALPVVRGAKLCRACLWRIARVVAAVSDFVSRMYRENVRDWGSRAGAAVWRH